VVKGFLFNVGTMWSLSTARHNRSSLHETTIERLQNAWRLTDTAPKAVTVPRDFSNIRRVKAVIWTVSDCLLIVAFRPISYNLWRKVFPWSPSIRDEGYCPHAAMVSQLPPPDPRTRASDRSYVRTMGEWPRWGTHVSGSSMRSPLSCPPLLR